MQEYVRCHVLVVSWLSGSVAWASGLRDCGQPCRGSLAQSMLWDGATSLLET